jgi:hypothetical protein
LFPFWDDRTKAFLKAEGQTFHNIIGPFEHGRTLHFLDFAHWKDRLFEVYEEVYQSPPVSWAQLRKDRRNPQQFWTFWIALVILGLTLVSTVTGIVSMATGIVQMNLALEASRQAQAAAASGPHYPTKLGLDPKACLGGHQQEERQTSPQSETPTSCTSPAPSHSAS